MKSGKADILKLFYNAKHKTQDSKLMNEKGIALMSVLVLSLICLAIVATLIYLVIQGTKFSGFQRRYATALEAGFGSSEITTAILKKRGNLTITGLPIFSTSGGFGSTCDCGFDPDPTDAVYPDPVPNTCLCRKLCLPTVAWGGGCSTSLDPTTAYDLRFDLQGVGSAMYQVSAKIVDTTLGNSDLSGNNLGGTAVVASSGTISPPPSPYLYSLEITSQDKANPVERSRLSVLYAF